MNVSFIKVRLRGLEDYMKNPIRIQLVAPNLTQWKRLIINDFIFYMKPISALYWLKFTDSIDFSRTGGKLERQTDSKNDQRPKKSIEMHVMKCREQQPVQRNETQ